MERFKKVLYCKLLEKEIIATYFIKEIKDSDGTTKTKAVEYFNCEGKNECEDKYHILDCTCFKELKHVEHDVNSLK
jgi:hypothetical protein